MARTHARANRLYRAVITTTRESGYEFTEINGPYVKPGPARQQITRAKRQAQRWADRAMRWHREGDPLPNVDVVTGVVEYTDADWKVLDD